MIHIPSVRDRSRRTSLGQVSGGVAIHDAVVKGKIHLAKFILDAVESHTVVNSRDAHGKTPLIRAVRIEDEGVRGRVVDLLVKYHADVNLVDNVGRSALSYACELHRSDVIKKLVKNNVDPNLPDKNGNSPLMYCAETGNAAGIEILSKSFRRLGLDVDTVNADGMTPLMVAAKSGYVECAQLLAHEAKASLSRRDNVHNMNAIDWAREGGCSTPDLEALQARSRSHSKSAVNLSDSDQAAGRTQGNVSNPERMLPKRGTVVPNPIASNLGSTASLPHIESDGVKEPSAKFTGSQPDIRHVQNDKRRFHQMSLGELSQRFQGLSAGSSPEHYKENISSPDTPTKTATVRRWCSEESSSSDSQRQLSIDGIVDDLKSSEKMAPPNEPAQPRPSTAVGVFNKRVQHVGDHRRRPLSANVANRHTNRQTKSFDSALSLTNSRPSNSVENLSLTVTQPLVVPHPPNTARTGSNLSRLSHLSKSTEIISNRRPSLEQHNDSNSASIRYMDLQEISGSSKRERQASLSPGDLSGLLMRPDTATSGQDFEHLPSISLKCTSREV
ncbi:POTE ankyrin domain family member A-like [Acanthaster planci]|uniref:POTE ankyrin domain family member A-like n=1 Tax=Acanthaster planci TaxID=133434 RepID=A0A8B7XQM6_ACAPL|nr:POTE ankyrin domain family member A-like [Acanthaster planci]